MQYFQRKDDGESRNHAYHGGFTVVEILVVLVIAGIIAAIAAPSWLKFWSNQEVTAARDELRLGILQAQHQSVLHRTSWRFTVRESGDRILWTVHANDVAWQDVTTWNALNENIVLDDVDTTLATKTGTYYVRFDFRGDVKYRLGTITVDTRDGIAQNKCVVVSTLIGKIRAGREHLYSNSNGRYCY